MIARKPLLISALFLLAILFVLMSRSLNDNVSTLSIPRVDLLKNLDLGLSKWAPTNDPDAEREHIHEDSHRHPTASHGSSKGGKIAVPIDKAFPSSPTTPDPSSDASNPLTVTDLNPTNHSQIHSRARMGMITMVLGRTNPTYERALRTHQVHAQLHGSPLFTLRKEILDIMYNKPMYILDLLFQELKKPDHERMEWFFWFDADTVIVNPQIPPDAFLPPRDYSHINFLAALDVNGLNAGVFFLKVSDWAIEVMSAVLAYRTFRPHDNLPFAEQTAIDRVIHEDKFKKNTAFYPQRWFNAYQGAIMTNESLEPWQLHRGDMMVHFAGVPDKNERMDYYADIFEQHLPEWEVELKYTTYPGEMDIFWGERRARDKDEREEAEGMRKKAQELINEGRKRLQAFGSGLEREQKEGFERAAEELRKVVDVAENEWDIEKMSGAMRNFTEANKLLDHAESDSKKDILRQAHQMILTAEKISDKYADTQLPEDQDGEPEKLGEQAGKLRNFLIENPSKMDEIKVATGALSWAVEHFREVWEPKITQAVGSSGHGGDKESEHTENSYADGSNSEHDESPHESLYSSDTTLSHADGTAGDNDKQTSSSGKTESATENDFNFEPGSSPAGDGFGDLAEELERGRHPR